MRKNVLKMKTAKPHNDGRHILKLTLECDSFKLDKEDKTEDPLVIILPVNKGNITTLHVFAPQPEPEIKDALVQALEQLIIALK